MVKGLLGPDSALSVPAAAVGGMIKIPPIGAGNVRLRLQRLWNHTPARNEFVPLARWGQPGRKRPEPAGGPQQPASHRNGDSDGNQSGTVLMTTVSFQGMHTVQNDVELCWWALTTPGASYFPGNGSVAAGGWDPPLLIGTGMEDFFQNAFSLSWLGRAYHNDDAGLTHIHGGPIPATGDAQICPTTVAAYM